MTRKPEGGRNRSFEIDVVHAKGAGDFMEVYGLNHGLIYLLKDPQDPLLHIHLFESEAVEEVSGHLLINKTDLIQHTNTTRRIDNGQVRGYYLVVFLL